MARDINLNSTEWCNLVFEGKNKEYGAYAMRQTSSKRHFLALGCILVFTVLIAFIPKIITAVNPDTVEILGNMDGPVVLSDLTKPEEEEVIVEPDNTPPPPPMVKAEKFTPPVITEDEQVNPENEMRAQEELSKTTGIISTVTWDSDITTGGVDPGEVLKEQRRQIVNDPLPKDKPLEFVEVMPQYPGGKSELMKYIGNNLKYPMIAIENGIVGRVILKFVVGKDGSISDIQIVKGIDPSCDREAVRVIQSMQKWIPGSQNGHPVAVYFTLPIIFQLKS